MYQNEMAQKMAQQAALLGGGAGGMLGAGASIVENFHVKSQLQARTITNLQNQLAQEQQTQKQITSALEYVRQPGTQELLRGLSVGRLLRNGDEYAVPARRRLAIEDFGRISWPPRQSLYDRDGIILERGDMLRLGEALALPDVGAVLHAFVQEQAPTADQLKQIGRAFRSLSYAAAQTEPFPALTAAQVNALAANIAAQPLAETNLKNLFLALMSHPVQSALMGLASLGPLSPAQANSVSGFYTAQLGALLNTSPAAAAAVATWIAANAPALADPALDTPWSYTFASLLGTPTNTTATPGGVVTGAVAASVFFKFILQATEQQTVRRFRAQITQPASANAAGVLARFFLPVALKGNNPPKVTMSLEGATFAAAGSPYINNVLGGPTPSFDVNAGTAGTASTVFNLVFDVSQ